MSRLAAICLIFGAFIFPAIFAAINTNFGPKYPPTKGEVWPKPQQEKKEDHYYAFSPSNFKINTTSLSCATLDKALSRYTLVIKDMYRLVRHYKKRTTRSVKNSGLNQDTKYKGHIKDLKVVLTSPCDDYPYFGMDESYNLTVGQSSTLQSASLWGALRGLETFAQLFYITHDVEHVCINATEIYDYPRYPHRGLLLDTSRHYISVANILTTLDAMAINKLNVFHWHIVDDQSFPYQSTKFPELSERGAYHSSMVYTRNTIQMIIDYARDRGIRVLPEFDIPGHTGSWGVAYPNLLTECYSNGEVTSLGPMHPTSNFTYKLLKDLFEELQDLFPDKYFHVGGDEVELECWSSNPELKAYMEQHNLTVNQLHALFMENTIPLLGNRSTPIVWQEVFDEHVPLSKDTLVQVWKYGWTSEMISVLNSGHKVIFSSMWYLDALKSGGNWEEFYQADPRQLVYDVTSDESLLENIVGGEACMWAEVVDNANVISRVWPRSSAVAERLWSAGEDAHQQRSGAWSWRRRDADVTPLVRRRLEEHTCRMTRRHVPAQPPNGPGFCLALHHHTR